MFLRPPDGANAACIAGEVRTLVMPSVQTRLLRGLITPLAANAFLVIGTSRTVWSWERGGARRRRSSTAAAAAVGNDYSAAEIARSLRAVSVDTFDDGPWPSSYEAVPHRHSRCWRLVLRAEESRGGRQYAWVALTRPDAYFLCEVVPPPARGAPSAFFSWDFLAVLPRAAAPLVLGRASSGGGAVCQRNSSAKFRHEYCGQCVALSHGFRVRSLRTRSTVTVYRPCGFDRVGRRCDRSKVDANAGGDPAAPLRACDYESARPWTPPADMGNCSRAEVPWRSWREGARQ